MRCNASVRLVFALALLAATSAQAFPITFSFTGSVTSDPFGLSSFGAPISGNYTFDSAALDADPTPNVGSYPSIGPGFGFSANVDGTNYAVAGSLVVNVANDITVDQYGAIASDIALTLELFFEDSTQTALSSAALPLTPPSLAAFGFREFRLFSAEAEFLGTVDTLVCSAGCDGVGGGRVPEPGIVWILATLLTTFAMLAPPRKSAPEKFST